MEMPKNYILNSGIMGNDLQANRFAPIYDDSIDNDKALSYVNFNQGEENNIDSIDDDKALSYVNFNQDEENPWYANLMEYTRNNLPNIVARGALMQAGMGAGAMLGGLPGVLLGLFAGAKAPFRDTPSMQAFNQLTPAQRQSVGSIYGQGGIMQGYNPISAYGRGPRGAIQNRIDNILARKDAGKSYGAKNLAKLQQALTQIGGGDGGGGNQGGGFDNTFQESYDWSADD